MRLEKRSLSIQHVQEIEFSLAVALLSRFKGLPGAWKNLGRDCGKRGVKRRPFSIGLLQTARNIHDRAAPLVPSLRKTKDLEFA